MDIGTDNTNFGGLGIIYDLADFAASQMAYDLASDGSGECDFGFSSLASFSNLGSLVQTAGAITSECFGTSGNRFNLRETGKFECGREHQLGNGSHYGRINGY